MSIEQLVALIASGVVALLGFFLRASFSSITTRLDKLETSLGNLLVELRAGNVIASNNTAEINLLRQRMHEISNQVQTVVAVQSRCRHCNGDVE